MKKKLILVGGGGHALSCIDVIRLENKFTIEGIIDKNPNNLLGLKHLGEDKILFNKKLPVNNILISIGQITDSKIRKKIFKKLKNLNYNFPIIKSPNSYISKNTKIGIGTIIHHKAVINNLAIIGENCIVNTGSIIEHQAIVESHCHISTGTVINGNVRISEGSFIGSNTVIKQGVKIGKNCIITAGKFINKNIEDNTTIK